MMDSGNRYISDRSNLTSHSEGLTRNRRYTMATRFQYVIYKKVVCDLSAAFGERCTEVDDDVGDVLKLRP